MCFKGHDTHILCDISLIPRIYLCYKYINIRIFPSVSLDYLYKKHKIIHRTNLNHQCMHANCGRWFMWDHHLKFHLKMHDKQSSTCNQCDKFTTSSEKYLKDHIKSTHSDVLLYKCGKCDRCFKYCQLVSEETC